MKQSVFRRSGLSALLFFSSVVSFCAEPKQVNFELTNGETVSFTLDQSPRITYGDRTVTLTYSNGRIEYNMSEIKKMTLGDLSSTGINDITAAENGGCVATSQGVFTFSDFPFNSKVEVYDFSGKLVESQSVDRDGSLLLDTNKLGKGSYIIKTQGFTYKFMKK